MKKDYFHLLLATTLLTACGGGGGGGSPVVDPSTVEDVGSDKTIDEIVQKYRDSLELNWQKLSALHHTMTEWTTPGLKPERITELKKSFIEIIPEVYQSMLPVYRAQTEILEALKARYTQFDATGNFSKSDWRKLKTLKEAILPYQQIIRRSFIPEFFVQESQSNPANAQTNKTLIEFHHAFWTLFALNTDQQKTTSILETYNPYFSEGINFNADAFTTFANKIIMAVNSADYKNFLEKDSILGNFFTKGTDKSAVDLLRNDDTFVEVVARKKTLEIFAYDVDLNVNLTPVLNKLTVNPAGRLTSKGAGLIKEISQKMHAKGFIRLAQVERDYGLKDITISDNVENLHSVPLLSLISSTAKDALTYRIPAESLISTHFGINKEAIDRIFTDNVDAEEDQLYINFHKKDSLTYNLTKANYAEYSSNYELSTSSKEFSLYGFNAINLAMYKTFVTAMIETGAFDGLFDFLKDQDGFKGDHEFQAAIQASAQRLASATTAALSADVMSNQTAFSGLDSRRASAGSIDAAHFNLSGVSGATTSLNLPLFVQLNGDLNQGKTTDKLNGSVAYRLGNTVIGAVQAYANSGKGFEADSYQSETSVLLSHNLGAFFVEGQLGLVASDNVHGGEWSGVRSQLTLGVDTAHVSPFVQFTHRDLVKNDTYTLSENNVSIGLDMEIANLTADTYTIDARLLTKVGFGNKAWSKQSDSLGSTRGFMGSVEWSGALHLNSGISFTTTLGLDSTAISQAGVQFRLNR